MSTPLKAASLVEVLRARDVALTLDGGRLAIRAPKNALSDDDKRLLALNRDAIIEYLRQDAKPTALKASAPENGEGFPLTEIQTAYWIGRQSSVLGGVGCHAYREFRLADLDLKRLERAWNQLIKRHGMLRAVFTNDGQQKILPQVPQYPFVIEDLRGAPDWEKQRLAQRGAMSHQMFDAGKWPLFEICLTKTDAGTFLHMGLDLLIADAASILLIYKEWQQLYDDADADLPVLERQFRDYLSQAEDDPIGLREAEAYWRPRLTDLPGPPQLPMAVNPAEIKKPHFVRRAIKLDRTTWSALSKRAMSVGMTPSSLLLAAFCDILACYARSQRFLLTLTTFRAPSEFAGVVGDFTSTLLVNVDARALRFQDRAAQVQRSLTQALEYDCWSGVRVSRELARLRGTSEATAPVVFTSALGHRARSEAGDPVAWLGKTEEAITQTPQVWTDHHVIEEAGGLTLSFDIVEGLFAGGLLDDMINAHEALVRALAQSDAAWDWPLGAHLSPQATIDRQSANDTALALPDHLLQTPVADQPDDRVAVLTCDTHVSYGELYASAKKIAAALQHAGLQPQECIAVSTPKGIEQIVMTLGVLLAGGAYVPVNPDLPQKRRQAILDRGDIRFVLSRTPASIWPGGVTALDLDQPIDQPLQPVRTDTSALAYVIFTSGSTGQPKGVMVNHRAAVNTIRDLVQRFDLGPKDAIFGLSDLGFDLSVFDIFGSFAAGARLVLPDAERMRDPHHWIHLIQTHNITVWNSVPALAGMLVEAGGPPLPSLRWIMLSGDWVPAGLVEKLRALAPNAKIIALGGATEAAIWSNAFDTDTLEPGATAVPYGFPLANQCYHVLNEALQPCPPGVPGQLHIAGRGLALGYLGDKAQTDARFFTHPVSGERLYATGDLGQYVPGGAIAFLGREDGQVKIDGHRIELGEIEASLLSHPDVSKAAAIVVDTPSGGKQLVAAVVAKPAPQTDASVTAQDAAALLRLKQSVALPKTEPSAPRIALSSGPSETLRRSIRAFRSAPASLEQISQLLSLFAVSEAGGVPAYRYPSAGSTYPVQVWLHLKDDTGSAPAGLYVYNRLEHDLELVQRGAEFPIKAHAQVNHPIAQAASFSIYFVLVEAAIAPTYGEFARDFGMIEVGAMTQLAMDQAAGLGLGLCPAGGLDTSDFAAPLGLSGERVLCLTLLGGQPGRETTKSLEHDLSDHVAAHLPRYMVPDHIERVDEITLNINGKVDRKAMAQALAKRAASEPAPTVAKHPQPAQTADPLATQIGAIIADVLDVASVGAKEAVFDLGGTSLHIVRLHRRLVDELEDGIGAQLDIIDVFRDPSVSGIVAMVRGKNNTQGGAGSARGARRRAQMNQGDKPPKSETPA